MKIRYDPIDNILLITLSEKPLAYGEEITPQVIAHYSKDNEPREMEVLDANELFSKKRDLCARTNTTESSACTQIIGWCCFRKHIIQKNRICTPKTRGAP